MPYLKSVQIYACPSDDSATPDGANNSLALSQLNAPTKTILGFEIRSAYVDANGLAPDSVASVSFGHGEWSEAAFMATGLMNNAGNVNGKFDERYARHFDGSNYLAMDGHVKWLKPQSASAGGSAPSETAEPAPPTSAAEWYTLTSAGTGNSKYALTMSIR